jgi:hypothetical protein
MQMNTYGSSKPTATLGLLWKRFQYWRAMRKLARIVWHKDQAERLYAEANKLMGRSVQAPLPLFDRECR